MTQRGNTAELAARAAGYAERARGQSTPGGGDPRMDHAGDTPPADATAAPTGTRSEWWRVALALTDEAFEVFFCPAADAATVGGLYPGATVEPMAGPSP